MEMDNNHFREEQSRTRKKKDKEKYTFILLLWSATLSASMLIFR